MVSPAGFVGKLMSDANDDSMSGLADEVRRSLHRFLDVYEPLRSDLYRYWRYLTRSPWDAEDLAQDAMARAFVTLGRMGDAPPNPRPGCSAWPRTCGSMQPGAHGSTRPPGWRVRRRSERGRSRGQLAKRAGR